MSDLTELPLKSLELPTKTVAKLKPLGIKTVGELYARSAAELSAAGLVDRELAEIAEAASTFGVTWSYAASPAAVAKPAPAAKAASSAKPVRAAKIELPADVRDAWRTPPSHTPLVAAEAAEIDCFAPYVDAQGRNYSTPPPSTRHLRLVRRLRRIKDASLGGAEREYLVGVIDVSGFPTTRAAELERFLMHVANVLESVVRRIGVKKTSQTLVGCAVSLGIPNKDLAKVAALVAAHAEWIGDAAPFGGQVPAPFKAIADAGLAQL